MFFIFSEYNVFLSKDSSVNFIRYCDICTMWSSLCVVVYVMSHWML